MSDYFSDTTYLRFEKRGYSTDLDKARQVASLPLQWNYGATNYGIYEIGYKLQGRTGSKVAALGGIPFSLAKMVYHLAKAIFINFPNAAFVGWQPVKIEIYCALREGMTAVGYLVRLCDDRWGSYLVEMNQFNKECYSIDLSKLSIRSDDFRYNFNLSLKTALTSPLPEAYKSNRSLPQVEKLQHIAEGINKYDPSFYDKCSVLDLFTSCENGYRFISDSELATRSLMEFGAVTDSRSRLLRVRLLQVHSQHLGPTLPFEKLYQLQAAEGSDEFRYYSQLPVEKFQALNLDRLTVAQVDAWLGIGERRAERLKLLDQRFIQVLAEKGVDLSALSGPQLQALKFSKLSPFCILTLFPAPFDESSKERFASLSPFCQMTILVGCGDLWPLVSDEQIKKFPLSKLDSSQINQLFPTHYNKIDDTVRARFALCDQAELQRALNATKIDGISALLFSDDQIKAIKLSELSYHQITILFEDLTRQGEKQQKAKARFELISWDEIEKAFVRGVLPKFAFSFIPAEVMQRLKSDHWMKAISELKMEHMRILFSYQGDRERQEAAACFARIPSDEIKKALENGVVPSELGPLIPDEFLRTLKLDDLEAKTVNRIIHGIFGEKMMTAPEEVRRRVYLIQDEKTRQLFTNHSHLQTICSIQAKRVSEMITANRFRYSGKDWNSSEQKVATMKQLQKESFERLKGYAAHGKWTHLQTFTPEDGGFVWWMFPVQVTGGDPFEIAFSVSEDEVQALKSDPEYIKNYRESVKLVSLSWGWDLENDCKVVNENQRWTGADKRLRKICKSLVLFGQTDLFDKLEKFIEAEHRATVATV